MAYAELLFKLKARLPTLKWAGVCLAVLLSCVIATAQITSPPAPVNLNTATAEQLADLPGIGPGLANRIIEHRRKHGPFKRPQDLIIVRGFSAKRFRQLAHLLTV